MKMLESLAVFLLWVLVPGVWTQSNYDTHGNSIEYDPESGLPPSTILDGKVTQLDELKADIVLNRTKAFLNCSQGSMDVELTFREPFYGIVYADVDRNSACMVKGRGLNVAHLELPLKGCGTKQDPTRVFTNNIVVRFHPSLEMDGDEIITIVCRYPPPKTAVVPEPIFLPPAVPSGPSLSGLHILLIICSLLFLALTLLGMGCSYMCLKRRPIRVVHRQTTSYTGSEITKISGSSLGNISMFGDLRIPRAHAPLHIAASISGSEVNLVTDHSDTLPSDYPSESHSEIDEARSLPVSSAGSYEKAFIHHQQHTDVRASSSLYSETINEIETSAITSASRMLPRLLPMEPKFDVQMRVKKAPPPPPSPLPSESDASIALERNLTTILEREEISRSMDRPPAMTTFSYVPELHGPPSSISRQQTPPVYSRILRKQAERETILESITSPSPPLATIHRPRSLASLNTEMTDTRSLTEVTDASHAKYRVASILAPTPPPPPPVVPSTHTHTAQYRQYIREEVEPLVQPVVSPRRPEITTHEVDDVFLRTVTEKKTIEDVERHRRQVTEYHAKPDPKWDVTIRNYPTEELPPPPPDWENFSDVSSASNLTITNEPTPRFDEPDTNIEPTYTTRAEIPCRPSHRLDPGTEPPDNWFTLSRVLESQYATEFTEDERKKWREIITTESTLRTLLTEAVVKEDYELIRKDARYTTLFPPAKWDVIIRILSPPNSASSHKSGQRYKRGKSSEWDNRSRRSSLPTLYEYESDGGSSIRTFGQDHLRPGGAHSGVGARIRRLSSTTRGGSEADLRSMSEMTVRDFARVERDDLTSLSSYEGESLVRSLSQPSLARSGSEFTEHWGVPSRGLPNWGFEDDACSSAETTPRPIRRNDRMEIVASFDGVTRQTPSAGVSSTFARSTRYERESIRVDNQRGPNWFHDDSEPEMQI